MNVFGILPGDLWGTPLDRVVVLGAHWDTMPDTGGFNDNGSGVAGVLEMARIFTSQRCQTRHTIIFAFFDLEEMGGQGSIEFVQRFLVPKVIRRFKQKQFGGSIILDTVMNFNSSMGTQQVPDGLDPEVARVIEANGRRGDFMAVVARENQDQKVAQILNKHWQAIQGQRQAYKMIQFPVHLNQSNPDLLKNQLANQLFFLRSDHSRFWITGYSDIPVLPSVLLTDTGIYYRMTCSVC